MANLNVLENERLSERALKMVEEFATVSAGIALPLRAGKRSRRIGYALRYQIPNPVEFEAAATI